MLCNRFPVFKIGCSGKEIGYEPRGNAGESNADLQRRLALKSGGLAVGQKKLGIENTDLIRAMDSFGGGLDAHGEGCGVVISGLAAIGLLSGRAEAGTQADMTMWKSCRIFMKRFRGEITDDKILCRDLVDGDWTDFNQAKGHRGSDKYEYCWVLTGKTARLIGEILEKAQGE